MWYVHRYETWQEYGGPEEGGWWYDAGRLDKNFDPPCFEQEELALEKCRELNRAESERRDSEEKYDYTSVLSYESTFYDYDYLETAYPPEFFPAERPHYE